MGVLICEKTGILYTLGAETIVGRSRVCRVRLDDSRVSREHAQFSWTGDRWLLLDLGSRNGTWLRSARLDAREGETIDVNTRFHFGAPGDTWRLLDDGPPTPRARDIDSGELQPAINGVIALPSAEAPELLIVRDGSGQWLLEQPGAGDIHELADLAEVRAAGRSWQLHLPEEKQGRPR